MNNQITISKKINLLGTILTVISYLFFFIFIIAFLFSGLYNNIKSIENQFSQQPDSYLKTGGIIGAIVGSVLSVIIMIYIYLSFARIHLNFKKFVTGSISRKKFLQKYISLWIIIFLLIFISFFSKSIAVIIAFLLILGLPILYLINIHKYTKNHG